MEISSGDGPFFSIILPVYDGVDKIAKSLDSAAAQAGATYEILIMDGGSTDGTVDVIKSYAERHPGVIRWLSEKDKGVYDAMNKGIGLARGTYLYFLGAGDMLKQDVLRQVQAAGPKGEPALVYGNVYWISRRMVYDGEFDRLKLVRRNPCHQAIFYHRAIFDMLGGFDLRYRISADWVFNMRCFRSEAIHKVHLDLIIADYEGGGMSEAETDASFVGRRFQICAEHLGLRVRRRPFFVLEGWVGRRIEEATGAARGFWLVQRWLLYAVVRPLLPKAYRALGPNTPVDVEYRVRVLD